MTDGAGKEAPERAVEVRQVKATHTQVREGRQTEVGRKRWMGGISSNDFTFYRVAL